MEFKIGDIVKLNPNISDASDYTEEELYNNRYTVSYRSPGGTLICKNLRTGLITARFPEEILSANGFRLIRREYLCQNLKRVST